MGSCKALLADIEEQGKENFEFRIIRFGESKSELAYYETKMIFDTDALLCEDYYNNIVNIRLNGNCLK